jgi:uncharacterized protein involved in tellurium resistance
MTKETQPQEDKISISKNELDGILKKINILEKSVSESKMNQIIEKDKKENQLQSGYLKCLDGEVIVRWLGKKEEGYKGKQEIIYNNNSPIGEIMDGHYVSITGKNIIKPIREFTNTTDKEYFRILKREEIDGEELLTIKFDNKELPQSFKIKSKFINS